MNTIAEALRYLADHDRPVGGQERFNAEHLHQLANEAERMIPRQTVCPQCHTQHEQRQFLGNMVDNMPHAQIEQELSELKASAAAFRQTVANALAALRAKMASHRVKTAESASVEHGWNRGLNDAVELIDATIAALGLTAAKGKPMFLLDDPGNNLLAFSTEAEAVAVAFGAIESYRSECAQTGEWSDSVAGVTVYAMPDDVTVDDCADYGIAESGCRILWESIESGNDEEGYDYKLTPAAKEK